MRFWTSGGDVLRLVLTLWSNLFASLMWVIAPQSQLILRLEFFVVVPSRMVVFFCLHRPPMFCFVCMGGLLQMVSLSSCKADLLSCLPRVFGAVLDEVGDYESDRQHRHLLHNLEGCGGALNTVCSCSLFLL